MNQSITQFTAVVADSSGMPLSPLPTFTWSAMGGGSINATTGLFTATTAALPTTVTASASTIYGQLSGPQTSRS